MSEKKVVDLHSPAGNSFWLMGLAREVAKKKKLDADKIVDEMCQSDYKNLVSVFKKHFGDDFEIVGEID